MYIFHITVPLGDAIQIVLTIIALILTFTLALPTIKTGFQTLRQMKVDSMKSAQHFEKQHRPYLGVMPELTHKEIILPRVLDKPSEPCVELTIAVKNYGLLPATLHGIAVYGCGAGTLYDSNEHLTAIFPSHDKTIRIRVTGSRVESLLIGMMSAVTSLDVDLRYSAETNPDGDYDYIYQCFGIVYTDILNTSRHNYEITSEIYDFEKLRLKPSDNNTVLITEGQQQQVKL